jgi:hypothetical protein
LDVVVASAMVVELQEQLLALERELGSREGTFMGWEDGMLFFECTLGRARTEVDTECD